MGSIIIGSGSGYIIGSTGTTGAGVGFTGSGFGGGGGGGGVYAWQYCPYSNPSIPPLFRSPYAAAQESQYYA